MKAKTLLIFLLCFFIIGNILVFNCITLALPSASVFFGAGEDLRATVNGNIDPAKHIQSLIMSFGVFASIIVALIYGIQWATATSARRQELKSGLWPLVIGIFLLAMGPRLVVNIADILENDGGSVAGQSQKIAGAVISILQTVGYITAIVMILVVGIQWTIGTPSKRQELKGRLVNVLIGAIIIVGSVTFLDWIYNVIDKDMDKGSHTTTPVKEGGGGSNAGSNAGSSIPAKGNSYNMDAFQ